MSSGSVWPVVRLVEARICCCGRVKVEGRAVDEGYGLVRYQAGL
jgi:hypothetical protein